MNRIAKFAVWFVVACVALFAVTAVAFRLFFDPNDYREDIESAVRESTGRELAIEGDIALRLFPWLAVEVGRTTLGNAPGFGEAPFAEVESARLSVRLWPLIVRREVRVGTAEIDGLRLVLVVDERGRSNWDDLVPEDEDTGDTPAAARRGALDVSGVDINNAFISYAQREKGDTYTLSDVNFAIGRIADDRKPVPASGSLRFDVQPAGMSGEVDVDTVVAFDPDSRVVTFDGFTLEGIIEGLAEGPSRLAFSTDGIDVQTDDQVVTMQPVTLSVLDIDARANVEPFSYAGTIAPTASIEVDAFSPRSLMTRFGVEPPETADPAALSSVAFRAKAAVREQDVALTEVEVIVDGESFTGQLNVPMDPKGKYRFDLSGNSLDVNRYMAPAAEGGDGGGSGTAAPVELPVDLIKGLNASGTFKVGSVQLGALQLDNVRLGLASQGGRLRVHPIAAGLYGGTYEGDVRVDASGASPVLSLNENVQAVDLAKLAMAMFEKKNITGSLAGNFRLSGRGGDLSEVQRTLGGTMTFELKDGTYEGTDVWYELRRARALLRKETPPEPVLPARTRFSSVKATGVVTDGIMRNDDFVADLPFMQLTGGGDVNIPDGTVDYALMARVFRKPEAMGAATPEEIEEFTKTVIPLKVTGPLASPKVSPDVEALLRQRVETEIKKKVEDKLKDLLKR